MDLRERINTPNPIDLFKHHRSITGASRLKLLTIWYINILKYSLKTNIPGITSERYAMSNKKENIGLSVQLKPLYYTKHNHVYIFQTWCCRIHNKIIPIKFIHSCVMGNNNCKFFYHRADTIARWVRGLKSVLALFTEQYLNEITLNLFQLYLTTIQSGLPY